MEYNTIDNRKIYIKWAIVCLLLLLVPYSQVVLFLYFSYQYFKNKYDSIDMVLLFFLMFFIQNIMQASPAVVMGIRYALIGVMFIKVFFLHPNKIFKKFTAYHRAIFIFFVYVLLHSLMVSALPTYSLQQLPLFYLLFFIVAIGADNFGKFSFEYKLKNLEAIFIIVIIFSAIVFPIRSISFARNGLGFQGISVHPNAFGIFLAPYSGFVLARFIRTRKIADLLFFVVSFVSVFLSQSRTSIFSIGLGFFIFFLIDTNFRNLFSKKFLFIILPSLFLGLVFFDKLEATAMDFLIKSDDDNFAESVKRSRGSLVENQVANIQKTPFFGIGFKVPSGKELIKKDDKLVYEKGNMLTATVEELGIVGFVIIMILFVFLIKKQSKFSYSKEYQLLPIIALVTTLGEATLFAIGGLGTFIWLLLFMNKGNYYQNKIEEE